MVEPIIEILLILLTFGVMVLVGELALYVEGMREELEK